MTFVLIAAMLVLAPALMSAFGQAGTAPPVAAATGIPQGIVAGDWIQLFNGKDLTDWTIKFAKHDVGENVNDTFRVEDGLLKVRYDKWSTFNGEFGHIFYRQAFAYYLLAAEYRFVGQQVTGGPSWAVRNNGLMLHSPAPRTMLKDQNFPVSLEVQLLGGQGTGPRTTANLCTPGTHVVFNGKLHTQHCTNSTSQTYDGDQWVRVEFLALGDSIMKHIANGDTVLVYRKPEMGGGSANNTNPGVLVPGTPITGGSISLQAETAEIDFRKVEVLNLEGCMDPKSSSYRPYFIKHDPAACK